MISLHYLLATPIIVILTWLQNLKPLKFYEARSSYFKDCDYVDDGVYVSLWAYTAIHFDQQSSRKGIILAQIYFGITYYPGFSLTLFRWTNSYLISYSM